jgi:hypothetical protein
VLAGLLNSAEARLRFGGAAAIQLYNDYTQWYNNGCPIPMPPVFSASPSSAPYSKPTSQWHIYLIVLIICCVGFGLLALFGVAAAWKYFRNRGKLNRRGLAASPSRALLASPNYYTQLEMSPDAASDDAAEASGSHGAGDNSENAMTHATGTVDGDQPVTSFAWSGGVGGGAATGTGILRQSHRTSHEGAVRPSESTALLTGHHQQAQRYSTVTANGMLSPVTAVRQGSAGPNANSPQQHAGSKFTKAA